MVEQSGRVHDRRTDPLEQDLMTPAAVVLTVAVLAHDSCPISGEAVIAAGGTEARMFVAETPGYRQVGHTSKDVLAHWHEIHTTAGAYLRPTPSSRTGDAGRGIAEP